MGVRSDHLFARFRRSAERTPQGIALDVAGAVYSYQQLLAAASSLGAIIEERQAERGIPLVAFLASRSVSAYAAVLGILASGNGYVPLNPRFPARRNRLILTESGVAVIVVGPECLAHVAELLTDVDRSYTVVCIDSSTAEARIHIEAKHNVVAVEWADLQALFRHPSVKEPDESSTAYLLFTSGTTGAPKGVPISQGNVGSYLSYVVPRYGFGPEDRCSQTFDLTFDLSVHDLFATWSGGATLCVPSQSALLLPASFIQRKQLTMWFSVPSLAMVMDRFGVLKPDIFPSLRTSLFCGEALSATLARRWQSAAPNSIVENLYGPTEATIAYCYYRWSQGQDEAQFHNGIVPIGQPFPAQRTCVIGPDGRLVSGGEAGELCLSGSQVTTGYSNDAKKTERQFVRLGELPAAIWYRTGDLVREDEQGCLHYLGRIDDQIQVMGHRVELQEIDNALRAASGIEAAVAVQWPAGSPRADAVYGFVCATAVDQRRVLDECARVLPPYMVPKQIFTVEEFPLNANGKIDRQALGSLLRTLLSETG